MGHLDRFAQPGLGRGNRVGRPPQSHPGRSRRQPSRYRGRPGRPRLESLGEPVELRLTSWHSHRPRFCRNRSSSRRITVPWMITESSSSMSRTRTSRSRRVRSGPRDHRHVVVQLGVTHRVPDRMQKIRVRACLRAVPWTLTTTVKKRQRGAIDRLPRGALRGPCVCRSSLKERAGVSSAIRSAATSVAPVTRVPRGALS
jgi:hypothetical protein